VEEAYSHPVTSGSSPNIVQEDVKLIHAPCHLAELWFNVVAGLCHVIGNVKHGVGRTFVCSVADTGGIRSNSYHALSAIQREALQYVAFKILLMLRTARSGGKPVSFL